MISAAFPRFAPRFSFDALRGRDRRWAAHFGLFLVILLAGIVAGQITRGDRGITPINSSGDFLASGILVDVTGENAEDPRYKGWRGQLGREPRRERVGHNGKKSVADGPLN